MMTKNYFKILLTTIMTAVLLSCKAQQPQVTNALPKVENYENGALDLMVAPFGLNGNEINVGKISPNGIIHFDWPEIDVSTIEGSEYFMQSVDKAVGMDFCNDKQIEEESKDARAVDSKTIFLYKKGMQVGVLYPATQNEIQNNGSLNRNSSLVLGSEISWFYCNALATFKAKCVVKVAWENSYNFDEVKTYDMHFKKGWNMVQHTLLEKEDWKNDEGQGSLPKTIMKTTITQLPEQINWYVKYWGE